MYPLESQQLALPRLDVESVSYSRGWIYRPCVLGLLQPPASPLGETKAVSKEYTATVGDGD